MYYVYILKSGINGKRYIGYTSDLDKRLDRHNNGLTRTTKYMGSDWRIIYYEKFQNKHEALVREKELKKMKGGIQLKNLIARV